MTSTEIIRVRSIEKPGYVYLAGPCSRCGGAGGYAGWPGFTCYRCAGRCADPKGFRTYVYPSAWTDEQVAEHAAKREASLLKRRAIAEAKKEAERAAWVAGLSDEVLLALFGEVDSTNDFVNDLRARATWQVLTDAQVDALIASIAREASYAAERAAREAQKALVPDVPVTDERITVEGEIVSVKSVENQFGSTLKMLVVTTEGYKLFGTAPRALPCVPLVGLTVRFSAKVERSNDDPKFGFFSRPTKTEVVE